MTERRTLNPIAPQNRRRTTWAGLLLAALTGLSQVPWDQVLAFANRLIGGE